MKLSLFNFLVLSFFLLASCGKGLDIEKDLTDKDDLEINAEEWDDEKEDCFKMIYPVSWNMPDGTVISGDDEETLWTAIKTWYEDHPDVQAEPTLNYPVQVAFPDNDQLVTINNEEEMEEAKKKCEDDWGDDKDCFKFLYPITYIMPDGTEISGGPEELKAAIEEWYKTHDTAEEPALSFPVQIVYPTSDMPVTINNEEELEAAKEDC